ncbi:hypothetical protein HK097_003036 [Rhizophlyctis rosea]|uniref:Uncharacterized protein n=1 Tax=Rhizophlyctis rosea TaxID=64517 RepID=A0AAD5WXF4_9FUNG|nr:hypothetical protein HK097_003036 [Rhizophlyctis rosea]
MSSLRADWNEGAVQMCPAQGDQTPTNIAYLASKNEAERAAWKFVEKKKPSFDLTTLQPVYVFGRPLTTPKSAQDLKSLLVLYSYAEDGGLRFILSAGTFGVGVQRTGQPIASLDMTQLPRRYDQPLYGVSRATVSDDFMPALKEQGVEVIV